MRFIQLVIIYLMYMLLTITLLLAYILGISVYFVIWLFAKKLLIRKKLLKK
jgi:hypothetical protein